uniref:Protein kinase domain-containing protein n=1 Tax=Moniliophthora roreri TaxID=221103 RepID=A0A0W0EUK3_MONRR
MHFVQTCRSQHENLHLFKSRGRLHVVQLLDRTEDGRLVFEKYPRISLEAFTAFDVMEALHSRGFVHRDVVARNFLQVVTGDGTLVACDLETDHASVTCKAPELSVENPPYTVESDVYGIRTLLSFTVLRHLLSSSHSRLSFGMLES